MKKNIIVKIFKEIINVSKTMFLWNYALTLLQGFTNAIPVIILQKFFDCLANDIKWEEKQDNVFLYLGLYICMKALYYIIRGITDYNYEYYDLKVAHEIISKTNRKVGGLNAQEFESSRLLDDVQKAYSGTNNIRQVVDTIMLILLYYVPEMLVVVTYLYKANHFLPLIFPLLFIVIFISEKSQEKNYWNLEEKTAQESRKIERYTEYISNIDFFQETKLWGLQNYFNNLIRQEYISRCKKKWYFFCKSNRWDVFGRALLQFGKIFVLTSLFFCVCNESVSLGVFSALWISLNDIFEMIIGLQGEFSGEIVDIIAKTRNYFKMQEMVENQEGKDKEESSFECIEFKDVSFMYPDKSVVAVDRVSLKISKGEHIAIVGENGSGKTTLVKLLCGLYKPIEGEIYYNGTLVEESSLKNMQSEMSAVFQSYCKYYMSVYDNIMLGYDEKINTVSEVMDTVGVSIFSNSEDNQNILLSREFGGVDISGGEWQRLAIARGMYRDKSLIFFDEPTSAIDPMEEGNLLRIISDISKKKTSIVVTHRLGSIRYADKIIVMKKGKIIAIGSHKDLLKNCNEYAKIWNAQAGLYHSYF